MRPLRSHVWDLYGAVERVTYTGGDSLPATELLGIVCWRVGFEGVQLGGFKKFRWRSLASHRRWGNSRVQHWTAGRSWSLDLSCRPLDLQVQPKISVRNYLERIDKYFACSSLDCNGGASFGRKPLRFYRDSGKIGKIWYRFLISNHITVWHTLNRTEEYHLGILRRNVWSCDHDACVYCMYTVRCCDMGTGKCYCVKLWFSLVKAIFVSTVRGNNSVSFSHSVWNKLFPRSPVFQTMFRRQVPCLQYYCVHKRQPQANKTPQKTQYETSQATNNLIKKQRNKQCRGESVHVAALVYLDRLVWEA